MTQQEYENKIKELEKQIEELKMVKVEEPQSKRWKPKFDDKYYYVDSFGDCENSFWSGEMNDEFRYLTDNCFKTYEEAEEYKKQIEYTARYKNYIEEHSEPIDWGNDKQSKYFAYVSLLDEIGIDCAYNWKKQGTIHASREQIIWDAIKEIGEDNFKKYVLGVK